LSIVEHKGPHAFWDLTEFFLESWKSDENGCFYGLTEWMFSDV